VSRREIPRPRYGNLTPEGFREAFAKRMMYSVAKDAYTATDFNVYEGLALAVRDRLMERWFATQDAYYRADSKRVYYLSMEFLIGRALLSNLQNLGALGACRGALSELGIRLEEIAEQEWDAGLGNGGLGRLAACFLDSAATLSLPFYGYGIRYEYGIFRQRIQDGAQVEFPDNWLRYGSPWEIPRRDAIFPINFYGRTQPYRDGEGFDRIGWADAEVVYAMAYDMPVVGYGNDTVNSLRLWAAKSSREFDLGRFNAGQYVRAVEDKVQTENISKVLYPPDDQYAGKELRLKQQYFFVSATLQDVLRRFRKKADRRWEDLPDKVAIQLNDTHPAVGIPELMRILVDRERLDWDFAWELTRSVFGYTNHTVLPEALECWPLELFGRLLPRHLEIVEEIDRRLREAVRRRHPEDTAREEKMAILSGENGERQVRMAHLAIVGSRKVNGVARLHTDILTNEVFPEFVDLFPGRFTNKTNGITPRRWLLSANPGLAALVTEAIGDRWTRHLEDVARLRVFADDASFRERFQRVKRDNKVAFARWMRKVHGCEIDPTSLFDVQVKRFHEYKRQLLNVLHVLALYHRIKLGRDAGVPRTVIVGGKAAPGYAFAKLVIKLVHAVGAMVNADPDCKGRLSLIFLPNYGVSCAEKVFPATDLSEQISTAGNEASGTGNMKAVLNGAVIIGTLDGANIEILEEVGTENMFFFGLTADEVRALGKTDYDPKASVEQNRELARVIETIAQMEGFGPIVEVLLERDRYFHCADFGAYLACQERVSAAWKDQATWSAMAIRNVAGVARFSSDRAVREYAEEIWRVAPVPVQLAAAPEPVEAETA